MTTADKVQARHAQELARSWAELMDTQNGRMAVWAMLQHCGVFRATFVPGAADTTAFNEGRRDVGLHLMQIAGVEPDVMALMQREGIEREAELARAIEEEATTDD